MTRTPQTLSAETGDTDITHFNALRHGVRRGVAALNLLPLALPHGGIFIQVIDFTVCGPSSDMIGRPALTGLPIAWIA